MTPVSLLVPVSRAGHGAGEPEERADRPAAVSRLLEILAGLAALAILLLPSFRSLDFKEWVLRLAVPLLAAAFAVRFAACPLLRLAAPDLLLLFFLAWAVLRSLGVPYPSAAETLLSRWLPAAGLYLILHQDAAARRGFERGFLAGTLLLLLYGLFQRLGLDPLEAHRAALSKGRIFATFGNPNVYGAFLVLAAPLLGAAAAPLWIRRGRRLLLGAGVLLFLINLEGTGSRGAFLAFGFEFLLALLFLFRERRIPPVVVRAACAGAAALALFLAFRADWTRPTDRLLVWEGALALAWENPLLGRGTGQFSLVFPSYAPEALRERMARDHTFTEHAHLEPLEMWAELGLVGLLWALPAAGTVLVSSARAARRGDFLPAASGLGLAGFLAANLFDYSLRLAGGAAVAAFAASGVPAAGRELRFASGVGRTFGLLLVLAALPWTGREAREAARTAAVFGEKNFLEEVPAAAEDRLRSLRDALARDPGDAALLREAGTLAAQLGRFDEAEEALRESVRAAPGDAGAWLNLGNVLFLTADREAGRLAEAEACYRRVLEADPHSVEARFNLAYAAFVRRDRAEALRLLDDVLRLDPDHARARALRRQVLP